MFRGVALCKREKAMMRSAGNAYGGGRVEAGGEGRGGAGAGAWDLSCPSLIHRQSGDADKVSVEREVGRVKKWELKMNKD